jgi:hypothetical protein
MERIPGRPPTPMEDAIHPVATEKIAARAEPVIPQTKGNIYFRLIPKIAGSVTPR